jgi:GNAT superfamily N-acetyltransferase
MNTETPQFQISRPAETDAAALGALVGTAFHGLPASRYLVPDSARRREVYPEYFRLAVLDTMAHGTPYAIGTDAVALWQEVGPEGPGEAELDKRLLEVDEDLAERDLVFHQLLHAAHPVGRGTYHWLMILGVHPELQGGGRGSALLAAHHAYLDQQGLGAYLEAASTQSRELYLRHGYVELDGGPIVLPDDSLMYRMWREPRPAAS